MYYCSEAAKYLPELDPSCTVSFEACAGGGTFAPPSTYLPAGALSPA